jgi:hypothetical protein
LKGSIFANALEVTNREETKLPTLEATLNEDEGKGIISSFPNVQIDTHEKKLNCNCKNIKKKVELGILFG